MKQKWLIPIVLVLLVIAVVYLWPVPKTSFEDTYSKASPAKVAALQVFRSENPVSSLVVDGKTWQYVSVGSGDQTILFLHGMTGAYDIWWQQIEAFKNDYRVISLTYPAVYSLEAMEKGVLAILDKEGVDRFNVVGTSLGGYFAQYLLAKHPERIQKAVFANTFPPNDIIKQKNGTIGSLVPYLPEWLVMKVLSGSFQNSIYPASHNDETTLAFMNEIIQGRMRKDQVAGRYACVVEKFVPPVNSKTPKLIIEASNDPLVEPALREMLRQTYPDASVVTVDNGHFPYISEPDFYNQQLITFFSK